MLYLKLSPQPHPCAMDHSTCQDSLSVYAGGTPSSAAIDLREHLLHARIVPHCISLLHAQGVKGNLVAAAVRLLSSLAVDQVFAAQLNNNGEQLPQAAVRRAAR